MGKLARKLRRRGAVLTALALSLVLVGTLGIGQTMAHTGEQHVPAFAEGGSTWFSYNPPGPDPTLQFWLSAFTTVKHRVGADGYNYYRANFELNSWRGAAYPAEDSAQAVDYTIRLKLYAVNTSSGVLTDLTPTAASWHTSGNGWSYGCQGDGYEVQYSPAFNQALVARLYVRANRKFYYNGGWVSSGLNSGYHWTSSHRLDSVWWGGSPPPPDDGHTAYNDPAGGWWQEWPGTLPNGAIAGLCPLWTVIQ